MVRAAGAESSGLFSGVSRRPRCDIAGVSGSRPGRGRGGGARRAVAGGDGGAGAPDEGGDRSSPRGVAAACPHRDRRQRPRLGARDRRRLGTRHDRGRRLVRAALRRGVRRRPAVQRPRALPARGHRTRPTAAEGVELTHSCPPQLRRAAHRAARPAAAPRRGRAAADRTKQHRPPAGRPVGRAGRQDAPVAAVRQARLADRGDHCYSSGGRARERGGGTCERIDMGAPLGGHGRAVGRPGAPFTSTPERHDHAIHL